MTDAVKKTIDYLQPPAGYFWRWAEKGEVIEWQTGATICYREELVAILRALAPGGLPPLGTLLLTLAACQPDWKQASGGVGLLHGLLWEMPEETGGPDDVMEYYIGQTERFLDVVGALPRELRTGERKIHLLHDLFRNTPRAVPAGAARAVVEEWGSGRIDRLLLRPGGETTRDGLKADLEPLEEALRQYPNATVLELLLRVGVAQLPVPAEVSLPEPQPRPLDLLDQLAEDPKTAGIARLTRRLVAALHIPMHARGSSDQPYGGVSDITNRGNFDRLLLSELAQDDAVLTARLVNHEAMFLRREEPPDHLDRRRTLLVDTTLKMWGLPRVFAVSAALACTRNARAGVATDAYALGGTGYGEMDLTSKAGVTEGLERLDPALHCGPALAAFMGQAPRGDHTEYILVTGAAALHDPAFGTLLAGLKGSLHFLVAVSRTGELAFYQYQHGRRSLLSTARFDLADLLLAPAAPARQAMKRENVPAFLNCQPAPLFYPTTGMRLSEGNTFYDPAVGVVGITEVQRLLYWPARDTGAEELLPYIEPGNYWFGYDGDATLYILVSNRPLDLHRLYTVHLRDGVAEGVELPREMGQVLEAAFWENLFFVKTHRGRVVLDCVEGKVDLHQDPSAIESQLGKLRHGGLDLNPVKKHINNGYTVLQRVQHLYLSRAGELILDHHCISLVNNAVLKLVSGRETLCEKTPEEPAPFTLLPNKGVKFRKTAWADGSEAIVDSRGLLHLRSADAALPEVTLVLVIGKAMAGWASDGTVFGSYYFTGEEPGDSLSAPDFYSTYIQPFIDRLPSHATTTAL